MQGVRGEGWEQEGLENMMGDGDRVGVQVKVQEEVGRAAGWERADFLVSGGGECSALWREEFVPGQCDLISSHHLLQCLRASGSGKSEPGAPQQPPPSWLTQQPQFNLDLRCHPFPFTPIPHLP